MYKIIDGIKYNTEAATLLAEYFPFGNDSRDRGFLHEALYRSQDGLYFLYGEGGADTSYGICTENNLWGPGEHIFPVSLEEAKLWTENYFTGDEYESIFGKLKDRQIQVELILDEEDVIKLSRIVTAFGMDYTDLITAWIRNSPV